MNDIEKILRTARDLIAEPDSWCQGYEALLEDGIEAVDFDQDPLVVSRCMLGAFNSAIFRLNLGTVRPIKPAISVLIGCIGPNEPSIPSFNDNPTRTHEQVIEVFDRAIKIASELDDED